MLPTLTIARTQRPSGCTVLIFTKLTDIQDELFSQDEIGYLKKRFADKSVSSLSLNRLGTHFHLFRTDKTRLSPALLEKWRRKGESLLGFIQDHKIEKIDLLDDGRQSAIVLAMAEGLMLGNYQFLKYRKDAREKESCLKKIEIISKKISRDQLHRVSIVAEAVYHSRSLVNEPLSTLNAVALADAMSELCSAVGARTEVLTQKKIESLKMGGLLAVNRGSIDPPTFTILEYKPEKPVNQKPLVLIGKGVVYDTGGLSLKPNSSMDTMKSDMAGAAVVAGALYAIAKTGLPLHVVALIPATDNRPDGNAYVPGDVIHMMDGTTVEVLNTDAEGRLILADALTFAKRYDPMLVIDLATLTGAAQAAIGKFGMVGMQSGARRFMEQLKESGSQVHERIAEFPFWEEYAELLKSDIADLKNIGGPQGGAITAGKFLEHFTDYPWIHLDIAGVSFLDKKDGYRSSGGTGTGVRLLFQFASALCS